MDDSNLFMQWAMNTLHQQQPSAAAAAPAYTDGGGDGEGASFPSLQVLRDASQPTTAAGVRDLTVQVDHRASSWSSGDSPIAAMDHDAAARWPPHIARTKTSGGTNRPMSWNFSAASAQPTDESGDRDVALPDADGVARAHTPPGKRGGSTVPSAAGGSSVAVQSGYVQDHIIAERRRREKINQRFIELSAVIPGLKKMDKATILGDAVKHVRELQEKVKSLEDDHNARSHTNSIQSVVLVRKPCLASDGDDGSSSANHGGNSRLPEIEARLSEKSVLLRIHCGNARGLLVRVLSEVEEMRLAITHTSVVPFPACTVIITITAEVEEGFNATVEEIVRRLNSALHQYNYSGNTEETSRK